ncbi:YggT family protein [Acuticoccus mangrovi]|uniref:YggT family protein n=1 Tax=Acuticoccus mangrovi TaxID=2796142 RepID=A0A934IJG6_9HYPH|nr:YggT family protein [Acuticoccus mangrovi]MBJ3776131.1 YggT family protein [Acuticoccus mangrovi]
MGSILQLILTIIQLYTWVVIASAVFSWLYAFNVVNPRNQFVATIGTTLYKLTEPALRPIRNVLPDMGGLDLSPLVLLLGLYFLQVLIVNNAPLLV